jgi:hypothetical protein
LAYQPAVLFSQKKQTTSSIFFSEQINNSQINRLRTLLVDEGKHETATGTHPTSNDSMEPTIPWRPDRHRLHRFQRPSITGTSGHPSIHGSTTPRGQSGMPNAEETRRSALCR